MKWRRNLFRMSPRFIPFNNISRLKELKAIINNNLQIAWVSAKRSTWT